MVYHQKNLNKKEKEVGNKLLLGLCLQLCPIPHKDAFVSEVESDKTIHAIERIILQENS